MPPPQIAEDPEVQRRTWRFERIGWILLAVAVVAAVLGLFGEGPLSRAEETSADGSLSVDFPRFLRRQSPESIRIRFTAQAGSGSASLWIDRRWLDEVTVESVTPEPERTELWPDRLVYRFARGGPAGTHSVHVRFEVDAPGRTRGEFGTADARVPVSHVVYP